MKGIARFNNGVIRLGDCIEQMRLMQPQSVHTCVTSPPYFGLRDYGVDGQIGLEPTAEQFVDALVRVFREVRRVLRDDGTVWLNLGDSYAGNGGQSVQSGPLFKGRARQRDNVCISSRAAGNGLKPKDMIGIPWMVAFALRADGWYLRQDIVWSKPNPMPESVRDRCTKAHEYVFLLSKSERYHFDAAAISEPIAAASVLRLSQNVSQQMGSDRVPGKTNGPMKAVSRASGNKARKSGGERGCPDGTGSNVCGSVPWEGTTRNRRSVWTIATTPSRAEHFATFPEALIEPCILAGSPTGGVVFDPFMGSGTTAIVAEKLGRHFDGCELNSEYLEIARRRIESVQVQSRLRVDLEPLLTPSDKSRLIA